MANWAIKKLLFCRKFDSVELHVRIVWSRDKLGRWRGRVRCLEMFISNISVLLGFSLQHLVPFPEKCGC